MYTVHTAQVYSTGQMDGCSSEIYSVYASRFIEPKCGNEFFNDFSPSPLSLLVWLDLVLLLSISSCIIFSLLIRFITYITQCHVKRAPMCHSAIRLCYCLAVWLTVNSIVYYFSTIFRHIMLYAVYSSGFFISLLSLLLLWHVTAFQLAFAHIQL